MKVTSSRDPGYSHCFPERRVWRALPAALALAITVTAAPARADGPLKFVYPVLGATTTDSTMNFISPRLDGWYVNNDFGSYCASCGTNTGQHPGEDVNLDCDTSTAGAQGGNCDLDKPVYAVADGTVIKAWYLASDLLNGVVIEHDLGVDEPVSPYVFPGTTTSLGSTRKFYSGYLHLNSLTIKTNDVVKAGDKIGTIGDPGGGAHLHFEMRATNKASFPLYQTNNQKLTDWGLIVPSAFLGAHMPPCAISDTAATTIMPRSACWTRLGRSSTWTAVESDDGTWYWTYTTNDAQPDGYGKWYFSFATAGSYNVEVFVPAIEHLSNHAKYKIWLGSSAQVVEVDQEANAGKFVSLGVFNFPQGAGPALRLDDNTGEAYANSTNSKKLAFGAIRISPAINVGSCATPPCEESPSVNPDTTGGCSFRAASHDRFGWRTGLSAAMAALWLRRRAFGPRRRQATAQA